MANKLSVKLAEKPHGYDIVLDDGILGSCGEWAQKWLPTATKIVIVSNPAVFELYGNTTKKQLKKAGFDVSHFLIGDGERFKTFRSVESILDFFSAKKLLRTDAAIALGGGVVGDLAGFAASIYLRGIGYLQIPTTLLSMVDSSVGGKTGVNAKFGKNLIGAFHQPSGVMIDSSTLRTLPPREIKAGLCEMVKHAALSGKALFNQTDEFLSRYSLKNFSQRELSNFKFQISNLIFENIRFKAQIVAGDEREFITRDDAKSRKILNFGHTLAHALEKATYYKYFKHGEAVGYGILFAADLSKTLALCHQKDVELLNDVVHRVGTLPRLANIDRREVFEAFRSDKKQTADGLQMVLLKGIGKPAIVSEPDIPKKVIQSALKKLFNEWA